MQKIRAYYEEILADFSLNDTAHMLHDLLKILENMQRVDAGTPGGPVEAEDSAG